MLKNYFKLAYRNLWNNKSIAFINIFGLSIAIATSIAVFLFLQNNWTMDNFHENGDQIYIAEYVVDNNGEEQIWGNTPIPLAEALLNDFPQIENVTRVEMRGSKVYLEDKVFEELVYFADPSYFDMFTFPLAEGSTAALNDPDAIILNAALAEKYFKEEDAIGKALTIVFDNQVKKVFTVKGVAAPFPENVGFKFDIITGFNTLTSIGETNQNDWTRHIRGTFIQLQEKANIETIVTNMGKYIALQNAANDDLKIKSFVFDNLKNPNPKAYDVYSRPAYATHPIETIIFSLMALLMMALSCFNYINIALGFAGKRLKEIGVRKAIGGKKIELILQFMSENLLLCLFALLLGLAITQMVLIPLFNSIMVVQISLTISENQSIWFFLLGLLGFTAIASGAYPAFYISAFQPASIFRGSQQVIKKNKLTRLFLGTQFVLAFSTVIIGVLLLTAGKHWEQMDWGYHPDKTLMVRLENAKQYDILKSEMERNPFVQEIGGSVNHVGESIARGKVKIKEKETEIIQFEVGTNYFNALGLQLRQGRFFDAFRPREDAQATVINQRFANQQAWSNPIGQTFRKEGQVYTVVGVVENFKIAGFSKEFPLAFYLGAPEDYGYMAIRHAAGTNQQVEDYARKRWTTLYPDIPFNYFHQNLVFENFYRSYGNVSRVFGYVAGLALLIACMGLFGLATQNYARYLKEASIRKVLGATVSQIVLLANRQFFWMLIISSVIATIICWSGMQVLLVMVEEYIGPLALGWTPFFIANLLVFITAIIAIGGQSYKLTKVAPADALRME